MEVMNFGVDEAPGWMKLQLHPFNVMKLELHQPRMQLHPTQD